MAIDDDARYRAICSRDARFDGKFFTGVTSTGVYCRPVCTAKTPYREHVRFFSCAAGAEAAGFRPCKRCRPESAPGTPVWNGTGASVSRAARLIEAGYLEEHSMEELAAHLGMGARHLRRLFVKHLGVAPKSFDSVRRTHLAARLLAESDLPITATAFEAGFRSIRQFNDAFRHSFGYAPSELRRRGEAPRAQARGGTAIRLRLAYRPPFDWDGLLRFFHARAIDGVEAVDSESYRRSIPAAQAGGGSVGVLEVTRSSRELLATLSAPPARLSSAVDRVRAMFDLLADNETIEGHLRCDPLLRPLVERFRGIRIPGSWDPFETAVRGVVGQQISVKAAVRTLGEIARLAAATPQRGAGEPLERLFPTPEQLLAADLERIGMPAARRKTLLAIAQAWLDGSLPIDGSASVEELVGALVEIPGVGPWTAHYIALRGFSEPDAFPASDLGLRAAVGRLLGRATHASAEEVGRLAEAWRPWRGYAAVLLWRSLAVPQ